MTTNLEVMEQQRERICNGRKKLPKAINEKAKKNKRETDQERRGTKVSADIAKR